jgi:hypothetical protein
LNSRCEDDPECETETEAIDAALNLVVFRKEILKSLEKVAGKGGVEKVLSGQAPSAQRSFSSVAMA